MILSHRHRFILLKTRKTGGTSFEIAVSKYMSGDDIVTPVAPADEVVRQSLGFTGPQNHGPVAGERLSRFYNHMSAAEVRALMPAGTFAGYVKAAIVRNPFDYVVSWYFWERSRIAPTSVEDFRKWLAFQAARRADIEAAYRLGQRRNPGVLSSNRMITHIDGHCAVDVMLRYESLADDIGRFARAVGLPETLADECRAIRTKASYRPASATPRQMFDGFPQGQKVIRTAFAEDIERYHYALA